MNFFTRMIKRLFSPEKQLEQVSAERELPGSEGAPPEWSLNGTNAITFGAAQSAGIVRTHNEDALLVLSGNLIGKDIPPTFGMFLVADGMGGHRAGEVASAISVRTVARHITESIILELFANGTENSNAQLEELLRDALEDANRMVVEKVPGGGTTLTCAVIVDSEIFIGHVGDSRAYVITPRGSTVLTRDHSLVERLRELGQLSHEEAAIHPQRNVLYRAIGQGANLEVDTARHPVPKGGFLLLCSDGLWGEVSDARIEAIVTSAENPQSACDDLVRAANAAGGPDNITAVLVRFPAD
jgi:protein phosphatase